MPLVKGNAIVTDEFAHLADDAEIPADGAVLFPAERFLKDRSQAAPPPHLPKRTEIPTTPVMDSAMPQQQIQQTHAKSVRSDPALARRHLRPAFPAQTDFPIPRKRSVRWSAGAVWRHRYRTKCRPCPACRRPSELTPVTLAQTLADSANAARVQKHSGRLPAGYPKASWTML